MPGGYHGIEFPGHFGPFGVHDWTDRGQRSNAVLTATTYIDRVEYTGDQKFMKTKAYPFLIMVLNFFEDYMIQINSSTAKDGYIWTSPDDCSMERCLGAPDAAEYNPIVTMGCLHRVLTSTLSFSIQLNVDSQRRVLWNDILTHLPPLARTVDPGADNRLVFAESTKPKSIFGANSWFPLDYFASLHPGSGLGRRTSDPSIMKIALNTVEGINRMNDWVPLSGMQMAWIGAVRAGCNGTDLLNRARTILSNQTIFYPNFYPLTGGGGLEQAGVTLAINEMLIQSHEGFLSFFPVWPILTHPAKFKSLRTVGAFLVDASSDPLNGVTGVKLKSINGGVLRLESPWLGCKLIEAIDSKGDIHSMRKESDSLWRFTTVVGEVYSISCVP